MVHKSEQTSQVGLTDVRLSQTPASALRPSASLGSTLERHDQSPYCSSPSLESQRPETPSRLRRKVGSSNLNKTKPPPPPRLLTPLPWTSQFHLNPPPSSPQMSARTQQFGVGSGQRDCQDRLINSSNEHILRRSQSSKPYSFANILREKHIIDPGRRSSTSINITDHSGDAAEHTPEETEQLHDKRRKRLIFQPVKRLPKPLENSEGYPHSDVTGLQSGLSRDSTRAIANRSREIDTSTISLSGFPLPPDPSLKTSSPQPKQSTSSQQYHHPGCVRLNGGHSPTVYHLRGVSFNVVNPHASLRLENIETPTPLEQDIGRRDYFSLPIHSRTQTPMATHHHIGRDVDPSSVTSTPQRSLFEDLQSAYNSITSRSRSIKKTIEDETPLLEMPSPPTPVHSRQVGRSPEYDVTTDESPARDESPELRRPPTALSFRQRFSQVFARKLSDKPASSRTSDKVNKDTRSWPQSLDAMSHESHSFDTYGSSALSDEPPSVEDDERTLNFNVNMASLDDLHPTPEDGSFHYYDGDSFFAQSDDQDQSQHMEDNSNPFMFAKPKPVIPYGHSDPTGSLMLKSPHAHPNDIAARFNRPGTAPPTMRRGPGRDPFETTSTIGEILDQYGGPSVSKPAISTSPVPEPLRYTVRECQSQDIRREKTRMVGHSLSTAQVAKESRDVRRATTRALGEPSDAVPTQPLPPNPPVSSTVKNFDRHEPFASSEIPSAPSYGDTRDLLVSPHSSIDLGRAVYEREPRLWEEQTDSDSNDDEFYCRTDSPFFKAVNPWDLAGFSPNSSEIFDAQHNTESRHLSEARFHEEFGSNMLSPRDMELPTVDPNHGHETHLQTSSPPSRTGHKSTAEFTDTIGSMPLAVFNRDSVFPGHRRSGGSREIMREFLASESEFRSNRSSEDPDWETLPASRPTFNFQADDEIDKLDSNSNHPASGPFGDQYENIAVHPANTEFQHKYALWSPDENSRPTLVPRYEFQGDNGFPNRNALTSPKPTLYTYKHPTPLAAGHENPFTSSPPQLPGSHVGPTAYDHTGQQDNASEIPHIPSFEWQRRSPLSVIEEVGTPSTGDSTSEMRKEKLASGSDIGPTEASSTWETTEAGDQHAAEPIQLRRMRSKAGTMSGVNPSLVQFLRDDDPRMPASPLSIDNSFAKVSHLGPKGNVTGTPVGGTGMRAAGSSVVYGSSPITPSTCITDVSPFSAKFSSSPLTPLSRASHKPHSSIYLEEQKTRSSHECKRIFPQADGYYRFGNTNEANKVQGFVPAFVPNQKTLYPLKLFPSIAPNRLTEVSQTREPFDRPSHVVGTKRPRTSRQSISVARLSDPRLHRTSLPSTVDLLKATEQTRKSWIVFWICCCFPPFLLPLGFGWFDRVMPHLTGGRIAHFAPRTKRVARYLGVILTAACIACIIAVPTAIHTARTSVAVRFRMLLAVLLPHEAPLRLVIVVIRH